MIAVNTGPFQAAYSQSWYKHTCIYKAMLYYFPLEFKRATVFIADRKEGLEPAFSEGPVKTLFR